MNKGKCNVRKVYKVLTYNTYYMKSYKIYDGLDN